MKSHVKTFETFLSMKNDGKTLNETVISFRDFHKFMEGGELRIDSEYKDVKIEFKSEVKVTEATAQDIKKIHIDEERWNDLHDGEFNYLRKKNIHSYKEFLYLVKESFKNKVD